MDVIYFFCESKRIRVPFYNNDRLLFNQLAAQGGTWDREGHQFIFRNISVQNK